MKRSIVMTLLLGLTAVAANAQHRFGVSPEVLKQLSEHGTVYVNTEAPGVHKEYDSEIGATVWRDDMGNYLCRDENMKPLEDIDKDYMFTGTNNDPDNPKTSYNVHKEWDKKRGCYVYKDNMGNFVGRDKPSMDKQEKWVKDKEKNWLEELKVPQGKGADKPQPTKKSSSYSSDEYDNSDGGYDQGYEEEEEDYSGGGMSYDEYVRRSAHGEVQVSKIVIRSDDELRRAEEGMKEVENAIKEIKKIDPSANVNEYIDPQIVKKVENAIKEYKRKHARG